MKHIRALLIKFVMITAVLLITLGLFYGVDFGEILTISLILTVGAYLLGDLLILSQFGNTAATIADFGLAYLGTWLIGAMIIDDPIRLGVASFISAAGIAIGEVFFHRYIASNVINEEENPSRYQQFNKEPAFQTEFAEETYPEVNAGYNRNSSEDNNKSERTKTNQNTYTTEFGEETNIDTDVKAYKKSSNEYYRSSSSTDTEFGEETFTVAGNNQTNTQANNQTKNKQNKTNYRTEFGEEFFPMSASSFFGEENQAKYRGSPNVTNDPSYYVNAANNTASSAQLSSIAADTKTQATNQTTASESETQPTEQNPDDTSFLGK